MTCTGDAFTYFSIIQPPIPIGSMYGIYADIGGILMVNVTIYGSTMDPMGYTLRPFRMTVLISHCSSDVAVRL